MKLFKFLTAIALACVGGAGARADVWSLDSCVAYAIEHNINVRQSVINARQSRVELTSAKNAFLPQVQGFASQNFSFGRGLTAENTYADRNTSSFAAGAQLSMPIFSGLRNLRTKQRAETSLLAVLERSEAAKDDVSLNVMALYLQALYASEMVTVNRLNLNISRDELARRNALLEAGKIAELDVYEARAQVSRDELSLVNAANDSVLAVLDLSQTLNLPEGVIIEPSPLQAEYGPVMSAQEVWQAANSINHAVRADNLDVRAAEQAVSVAKTGWIPTLSFNAGLSTNYYRTTGFNNESFGSQMRHNFAQSLGFSLSVPIFDAFGTRNNVRRARLQHESAILALENTRLNLRKAIEQSHAQAVAAAKKQIAAETAAESAAKAFEAMQVKYDHGRATPTEFAKAKTDYMTALSEQVQAKYETILRTRILTFYARGRE
ncbi:MAG: TolC family protein [Muribaculaceae bacterium]|nr:TolC family protein [Muribaculaceae bacterium]